MSRAREPFLGENTTLVWGFRNPSGETFHDTPAIFPILSASDGRWEVIGTGFFITSTGLFVSAKHVLMAVVDPKGRQTHAIFLIHRLPGNRYLTRPILRAVMHPVADIAVGVAAPIQGNATGGPLTNQSLRLTVQPPRIGSRVATYAFANPTLSLHPSGAQQIDLWPALYDGEILEYYPDGRDKIFLPGHCYRTTMVIHERLALA